MKRTYNILYLELNIYRRCQTHMIGQEKEKQK